LQITEDRKRRVIDLYFNQHKSYAEIAQIEKMSPRDIHAIIKEEETRRQKHKDQQQHQEMFAKSFQLFSEGKRPVQVAIKLNLGSSQITKLYIDYWKLKRLHILNLIHKETNGRLGPFLKLYKELVKKRRMSIEQIVNVVEIAIHRLPYMETLYIQAKDQAEKMQRTIQRLANDIEARKKKISALDKTTFSCEQNCKRTEHKVQELTAKKDRIENLIANILNGEDYAKLRQIVKENVKAVLSEKRVLISISFAAVIQTLKADPQMVKLIQNMPSANDGEQYNDNNNITQYFESNKDRILNLGEKNYENLIETLTDNVTNTVGVSSSNSTLSVPQSSSTFPNLPNQTHTYRKDDSEIYHNSKGDIAD
jgi:hypothetical protein